MNINYGKYVVVEKGFVAFKNNNINIVIVLVIIVKTSPMFACSQYTWDVYRFCLRSYLKPGQYLPKIEY